MKKGQLVDRFKIISLIVIAILIVSIYLINGVSASKNKTDILANEWFMPDASEVSVVFNQNKGVKVTLQHREKPYYMWTGDKNNYNTPPSNGVVLEPGEYRLTAKVGRAKGNTGPMFWVFMFDDHELINKQSYNLLQGNQTVEILPGTTEVRFGLRFLGDGEIQFDSISLTDFKPIGESVLRLLQLLFFVSLLLIVLRYGNKTVESSPPNSSMTLAYNLLVYVGAVFFVAWVIYMFDVPLYYPFLITFLLLALFPYANQITNHISLGNILIVAFFVRLVWSVGVETKPYSDFLNFWNQIRGYSFSELHQIFGSKAPATVFFYGSILHLNKSLWLVYLINALLGGFQVYLVYQLAKRFFVDGSAKIAALLYAFFPSVVFFSSVVSSETLMVTFTLWATWLLFKYSSLKDTTARQHVFYLSFISLFTAVAYLSRNTTILFLLAVIVYLIVIGEDKWRHRLLKAAAIGILFLAFISPQIIWNYHQYGKMSITSQQMGNFVLLFGTSEESKGGYNKNEIDRILSQGYSMQKDFLEVQKIARELAISRILDDPVQFFKFAMTDKFQRMWSNDNTLNWSTRQSDISDKADFLSTLRGFMNDYYLIAWILALISLVMLGVRLNKFGIFVLTYLLLNFGFYLFYEVQPRYHLPLIPYLCILAAQGFALVRKYPFGVKEIKKMLGKG